MQFPRRRELEAHPIVVQYLRAAVAGRDVLLQLRRAGSKQAQDIEWFDCADLREVGRRVSTPPVLLDGREWGRLGIERADHAKGVANGYVLTLGGKRVYFAGVTECVPEIKALRNIDVAFLPMNLPHGRMTPSAVAECVRSFRPAVVYPYHYDQGYIARLAGRGDPAGAAQAADSVKTLAAALKGVAEVRQAEWYPVR